MLKKYLLIFNNSVPDDIISKYLEAISSNYISKVGGKNIVVVLSSDSPQETWKKIDKNCSDKYSFVLVEMKNWYGRLPKDVFKWLEEKFPEIKLLDKID